MLVEGTFVTLYMTLVSTFMGYVLGLPMGIALVITAPKGLRPNKVIYKVLDVVVNVVPKLSVFDFADHDSAVDPYHRRKELWTDRYHRSVDTGGGTVYSQNGRVLSVGSGSALLKQAQSMERTCGRSSGRLCWQNPEPHCL